ncbi:division inhibitor protein [Vibrio sp. qd031]|uniref:nucleoid occlusion factor SlmA n=1 Tax=Vibrio sp. qd031 TaxID=1603038 RepID=UPI000A0FF9C2|nr:nucleoid occlusion factor SlmA [Vibrio sp. qd031]ORT50760.1 division inhibitor protein [Vibrio sp. qd031]
MSGSRRSNRREEILQALAEMLESSEGASRITTAKLAQQVGVSEAALYRHFPSKARMFEGLIEFIEESVFSRINHIMAVEKQTLPRLEKVMAFILLFAEHNKGLSRIMSGHALMFENDRLRDRINQFFDKIESQLKQILRERALREGEAFSIDERLIAATLLAHIEGKLNRFVRSDFTAPPTANFDDFWALYSQQLQ